MTHIPKPLELERKINNRFVVNFLPPLDKIAPFVVKEISRPKFDFINRAWCPIQIKLIDPIGPSTTHAIMQYVEMLKNNKFESDEISFNILLLDPVGLTIEKWTIAGYLNVADLGTLDMFNNAPLEIMMVVDVKDVILEDFDKTIQNNTGL